MRKAFLLLLVGSLPLGGLALWAATAARQTRQLPPVVVVSLASYDKTLDNVALLGNAFGNPELAQQFIVVLKLAAIQQGLTGPDKTRPWGAVVQADGDALTGCAFIPAADISNLASAAEPLVGKAEQVRSGVYAVRLHGKPVYLTHKGGWAFFASTIEALDSAPADPAALLAGLSAEYDAAVRFHPANIPAKYREQFFQWLSNRLVPSPTDRWRHEPDRVYALRKQVGQSAFQSIRTSLDDVETVTAGWTLDTSAKKTYLELGMTAKEGSQSARALTRMTDVKSQFRGFRMPDAAMTGNWAGQLPAGKAAVLGALAELFRVWAVDSIEQEGNRVEEGKLFAATLAALAAQTVNSGRADGGMAVLLRPDGVTFAAGGYVADGARLTDAVKLWAKVVSEEKPEAAKWIKLDAEEFRSVHIHTVSVPIPAEMKNRAQIVALIGEKLEVAVGVGPQSAYFAVGRDPVKVLKQVIEQSAADGAHNVPPVEFSLAAGAMAQFVAATVKADNVRTPAAILAAALAPAAGRDHVKLMILANPRGVKYRMEVEEGVLDLVGRLRAILTRAEPDGAGVKQ